MTNDGIRKARKAAEEFVKRASAVLSETSLDVTDRILYGSKLTGALRRSSLELTRALAEMRKQRT